MRSTTHWKARSIPQAIRWLLAAILCFMRPVWAVETAISLVDDRGRLLSLGRPPLRIVSLLPSLTESICALGACSRLIATDRFSDFPAQVRVLPKLGDLETLQWERLKQLKPDLVLVSTSMRQLDRIEALGMPVIALDSQTHEDVRRSIGLLAKALGDPQAGERLWSAILTEIAAAAASLPESLRQSTVYIELGPAMHAAGPGSFLGESLNSLNLKNIVPAAMGQFPQLSTEWLLTMQPQWIVMQTDPQGQRSRRPGWRRLQAIERGRVCELQAERLDVLLRPGPRLGEAARILVQCMVQQAARTG